MILIIILAIIVFLCFFISSKDKDVDNLSTFGLLTLGVIVCIILSLCLTFAIGIQLSADAKLSEKQAEYEVLIYQLENNFYDNDNDYGKKELMDEVKKWNEDLAYGKIACHNPWYGVFYPDRIYENLKPISYDIIE